MSNPTKLVTYEELKPAKGIQYSRMQIARLMKAGRFPQKVQISSARIGWIEREVDEWIASKADARQSAKTLETTY